MRTKLIIMNAVWRSIMEIPSSSSFAEEIPAGVHFNFFAILFLRPTSACLWIVREKKRVTRRPFSSTLPFTFLFSLSRHLLFHDKFIPQRLLRLTAFILPLTYHFLICTCKSLVTMYCKSEKEKETEREKETCLSSHK